MFDAFVTPRTYRPRMVVKEIKDSNGKPFTVFVEHARYTAYLGGNDADKVASKIGLKPSCKTAQGFWLLSSNTRKKAIKCGVEILPEPEQIEKLNLNKILGEIDAEKQD